MGFRITTNMTMNSYRYNLQNSTKKLSDARDMVLTQRNFNSYAEDPAAATLAFRLRRSWAQTSNYLTNTKDVYSKFNTAWNNLTGIVHDLSDATARVASIRGNNGTAGESRTALATVLRETAKSVVQAMNQKLGDHFIFAGNDALNAPFSWEDGRLLYRGVDVAGVKQPRDLSVPPDWGDMDADGIPKNMPEVAANDYEQAWLDYYNDQKKIIEDDTGSTTATVPNPAKGPGWAQVGAPPYLNEDGTPNIEAIQKAVAGAANLGSDGLRAVDRVWIQYFQDKAAYEQYLEGDYKKLEAMCNEEMYIDLGMGAAEKSPNNPVMGTYFNSALSGVDFLGFGTDEDGDPLNLALIMQELADVFDDWDEDGQMYLPNRYRDMSREEINAILESEDPDVMKQAAALRSYHAEQEEKAYRLMDKLKAAQEHLTEKWVELDSQSVYLQSAESRLTTQAVDLNIQFLDIEQVDMADAITNFTWQYSCYNAALKIGTQLLGQTLIDYMS